MIRTLILLIIFFGGTSYTSSGLALGMLKIWKGDVVVSSTSQFSGCITKSGMPLNNIISGDLRIEAGANLSIHRQQPCPCLASPHLVKIYSSSTAHRSPHWNSPSLRKLAALLK